MKLLVKKLWFRGNIDDHLSVLFKVPGIRELFDQGYNYDGEMRPRGVKISPYYWPAQPILDRLPDSGDDVYIVLTTMDLKGDYPFLKIAGRGYNRRCIASNWNVVDPSQPLEPGDIEFIDTMVGEIGHALGLSHHWYEIGFPCVMSHNELRRPKWWSPEDIEYCPTCFQQIKY